MSSPAVVAVAKFVRDLLTYDEQLIRIGRQDFEREQFEKAYIVVDDLGEAQRIASGEEYDGSTGVESMNLSIVWRGPVTLDFYGDDAYARALDVATRMRSQAAAELQQGLGLAIFTPSGITDLKQLTGQQYGERVQMTLTVHLTNSVDIDTLRIDTAQLEIRNEQGVQFNG